MPKIRKINVNLAELNLLQVLTKFQDGLLLTCDQQLYYLSIFDVANPQLINFNIKVSQKLSLLSHSTPLVSIKTNTFLVNSYDDTERKTHLLYVNANDLTNIIKVNIALPGLGTEDINFIYSFINLSNNKLIFRILQPSATTGLKLPTFALDISNIDHPHWSDLQLATATNEFWQPLTLSATSALCSDQLGNMWFIYNC